MATASSNANTSKEWLIVTAIDIGTTFSGWAYSTVNDPEKIYANQTWYAGEGTLASLKTSSCILFTPEKEFKKFGYEAETEFVRRAEENKHREWYFFERFKMALIDDRKINRNTQIKDISGKKMPALNVFANAIKFLKDNFYATYRKRVTFSKETDVTYVLTVPSIWNDMAKRFMREAAFEAGIPNNQLIIALESEAAAIWCQRIPTELPHRDLAISTVGTCNIIVDLGGGTADITVHKQTSNDTLVEIHKPTGGPWGGVEVDKKFIELMKSFFGSSHWKDFEENELEDLLSVKRDFETQKRIIKLDTCNNIVIKIPRSLEDNYEPKSDTSENLFGNKIVLNRGKLRIDVSLLKKCFADPVDKVIGNVKKILSKKSTRNVSRIILVGGFSESLYVQGIFEAHFADKSIFIPPECGLAVLKGAVLFGQNPSIVTARIARFTYGLEIAVPFDPKIHPSDKRRNSHAGPVCIDSFWKAVEKGEVIKDGYEVSRVGKAAFNNQCRGELKIFKSKSRNPMFTTDHGCECIGSFVIPMNRRLKAEDSNVSEVFIFGSTELRVRAKQRTFRDTHEIYIHM